jgi:putative hydrolase of the HAD superfamily
MCIFQLMILFDLDDTLFDNAGAEIQAAERFFEKHQELDRFAGPDDFVKEWRATTEIYLQMYIEGRLSFQEQRRHRLKDIFGRSFKAEEADTLFEQYLGFYEDNWELFPDALPCLDRFTSKGLGIVTNGNSRQQRQKLTELGIIDRFEIIIISEEVGVSKPRPQIFRHACNAAGKNPSDCVYVGDKLEIDARAASDAGLTGIWLNRNQLKEALNGIHEIQTLDALHGDYFS